MQQNKLTKQSPLRQGGLDGLCGLYSVINATKLLHGSKRIPSKAIFTESLHQLAEAHDLPEIIAAGMTRATLSGILKVASKRAPVSLSWPFYGKKRPTLDEVWAALEAHVCEGNGRTAIIAFGGSTWGHWTVVRAVTPGKLVLYDSRGRKHILRGICTTGEPTKSHPVSIEAQSVCFLSKGSGPRLKCQRWL